MHFLGGLIFGTILVMVASLYFDWSTTESAAGLESEPALPAQISIQNPDTALEAIQPSAPVPAPAPTPIPQGDTDSRSTATTSVAENSVPKSKNTHMGKTDSHPREPESTDIGAVAIPEPDQSLTADAAPWQPAPSATPEEIAPEPASVELPEVIEPTTVSVWQPFHSEVSANGFAKRLSLQLGYPFSVIKTGPAKYHVVFRYTAESERELLSAQLATLTGVSPQ